MSRMMTYGEAVRDALDLALAKDPSVYVMGLGVPDPKGIFGTTKGLQERHGSERVLDMPCSENGMTGVAIGSALTGLRPVMTHQRIDFALLAVEQIVNQAANWRYMFGGLMKVPLTIRLIVGRGWGQGPQHSQSLQAWFAHVPGLKVALPATPGDAKGMLIAAIEDDGPVIFIEHRWLHSVTGEVPEGIYRVALDKARVAREGRDLTIASLSYMTIEALRAAEALAECGIEAEVIDLRSLSPLDEETIFSSVKRTGRLIAADLGWKSFGAGAEIVARVAERNGEDLRAAPVRIALPDCPTPTSPELSKHYYPRAFDIFSEACRMLGRPTPPPEALSSPAHPLDVPDPDFKGPF